LSRDRVPQILTSSPWPCRIRREVGSGKQLTPSRRSRRATREECRLPTNINNIIEMPLGQSPGVSSQSWVEVEVIGPWLFLVSILSQPATPLDDSSFFKGGV
jgi:hypothetical protein